MFCSVSETCCGSLSGLREERGERERNGTVVRQFSLPLGPSVPLTPDPSGDWRKVGEEEEV